MVRPSVGRGPRRIAVLLAVAALVLGAIPGSIQAADPRSSSAHDPARMRQIVDKIRAVDGDHAHADGASHDHGGMGALGADDLAYLGLRVGTGACAGMYQLLIDDGEPHCSHGLDVDVPDLRTGEETTPPPTSGTHLAASSCADDITTCPAPAGWKLPTQIPCYSTGPFVEVLYVYWGTGAYSANKERIRRGVASIDLLFKISAAAVKNSSGTAGNRHVRWAMNTGCDLKITAVKMPSTVGDGISSIKSNLVGRGIITTSRKYLAFVDNGYCSGGIAEVAVSSSRSSTNPNNKGGSLGMAYDCFDTFDPYAGYGANIAAHELMHTLGAVEYDAPHTTKGHCWDDQPEAHAGADIMCYNDFGVPLSKFYGRCASTYPETFDCGKDDYYNPFPSASSYLGTHWNTAGNKFLATTEPPAWQQLPKPVVSFTKPAASGGAVGGSTLAAIKESGVAGIPIRSVTWTVNGVATKSSASAATTLGVSTFKTRTGGYANGTVLTIGAKVVDEGGLGGSGTTTATVANPYVRITAPPAFAQNGGTVPWAVTASATGGRTVTKVDFLVDGVVKATDTTAPYAGTYTVPLLDEIGDLTGGQYTVAARVTDSAGVMRQTATRTMYRASMHLAWKAPYLGAGWDSTYPMRVPAGRTVPLTITASSSIPGGVHHVDFLVGSTTVGTDTSAPYTYDLKASSTIGTMAQVTARAVDAGGNRLTTPILYIKSVASFGSQTATITPDPAADSGDIAFKLTATPPSGGSIDSACLYVDDGYGDGCLYPEYSTDDTITLPASTYAVGGHVASWHVGGYIVAGDYNSAYWEIDSGHRRFTVTGTSGAPSVALSGLTPAGRYKGKVTVGASVSGLPASGSVQYVEFFEGGRSLGMDFDAPYTAAWNTAVGPDGARSIGAEAVLNDGTRLRSTGIDVLAANVAASLTAPLAGATLTGVATLSGTGVYDADTALESAAFLVDGVVVNRDRVAPFSYGWNTTTVANGAHAVAMRLQLSDGRTVTTPAVSVTVGN